MASSEGKDQGRLPHSSRVEAKETVNGLNADALKMLGDPRYTDELEYEQNRVEPRFPGATSDIREIASDYADIQKELWRNGCHDPVFYFMSATGKDQDGNTVLMDFHEITRDEQAARRDVKNRKWESQDDYNWRLLLECISETSGCKTGTPWDLTELPARIHQEFSNYREECDEVFRKELSPEKLEEIWGVV